MARFRLPTPDGHPLASDGRQTIDAASILHDLSTTAKIRYCHVDHLGFSRFSRASRRLLAALGESAGDPFWSDLARAVRRYRFTAAASPLPFDDSAIFPRLSHEQLSSLASRTALAYPSFAASTKELVELLAQLRTCHDNPLLGVLEALAGQGSDLRTAVIVADNRLVERTRDVLGACAATTSFDVLSVIQGRDAFGYERIVIIGASNWLPDYIFSAPRAPELIVVSYRWIRSRWQASPTFAAGWSASGSTRPSYADDDALDAEYEPPLATDWSDVVHQATLGVEGSEAQDLVEARIFALHGGYAVLLDVADRASALAIDLEADEATRVQRVATNNIQPGMFLLLRTEGGGDYVALVADRILGRRTQPCREAQREWKQRLRTEVRRSAFFPTALRLVELGSGIADEQNVRNWMSERSICTRDKEDFAAILRLVGLDDRSDEYWLKMKEIRHAHQQAGARIRRQLLDRVARADLARLEREGQLDFVLPDVDGGKLTALRVEARSPDTVTVPESRTSTSRPFRLED